MPGQLWPLPATVLLVMLLPDYAAVRCASATRPSAMAVISTYASRGSVASQPVDSRRASNGSGSYWDVR